MYTVNTDVVHSLYIQYIPGSLFQFRTGLISKTCKFERGSEASTRSRTFLNDLKLEMKVSSFVDAFSFYVWSNRYVGVPWRRIV